jgi:hypothetical protein
MPPSEPATPRGVPAHLNRFVHMEGGTGWFFWKPGVDGKPVCVAKIAFDGDQYHGWSSGAYQGPWRSAMEAQDYLRACVSGLPLPEMAGAER